MMRGMSRALSWLGCVGAALAAEGSMDAPVSVEISRLLCASTPQAAMVLAQLLVRAPADTPLTRTPVARAGPAKSITFRSQIVTQQCCLCNPSTDPSCNCDVFPTECSSDCASTYLTCAAPRPRLRPCIFTARGPQVLPRVRDPAADAGLRLCHPGGGVLDGARLPGAVAAQQAPVRAAHGRGHGRAG